MGQLRNNDLDVALLWVVFFLRLCEEYDATLTLSLDQDVCVWLQNVSIKYQSFICIITVTVYCTPIMGQMPVLHALCMSSLLILITVPRW